MSWSELMPWGRAKRRPGRVERRSWREMAAAQELPCAEPEPEPESGAGPCGCGWFDSSAELRAGLLVTEHLPLERLAAALPLEAWIGRHLGGWRPGAQPAGVKSPSGLRQP